MSTNTVTNWFGNIVSHPSVIVDVHSADEYLQNAGQRQEQLILQSAETPLLASQRLIAKCAAS